jgi:hypothetical protein
MLPMQNILKIIAIMVIGLIGACSDGEEKTPATDAGAISCAFEGNSEVFEPGEIYNQISCLRCAADGSWEKLADGAACDDELDCTAEDKCTDGKCSGTPTAGWEVVAGKCAAIAY